MVLIQIFYFKIYFQHRIRDKVNHNLSTNIKKTWFTMYQCWVFEPHWEFPKIGQFVGVCVVIR